MAGNTVILEGGEQLARRFAALSKEAGGVVVTAAAIAGASVIREEVENLAPRDPRKSFHGADNIELQEVRTTRTRAVVNIGYEKTAAWWLKFQELGTKFHRAQPHLRPAMDTKKEEATRMVGRVLRLGIDAARRAR